MRRPRVILLVGALAGSVILAGVLVAIRADDPDPPLIGVDHWHASYDYIVCDEVRPNAPFWEAGINSEGDGIIHVHPFTEAEEGRGARLVKWFEYGGGKLTKDEVRLPGDGVTYRNGDRCPNGAEGVVQVFVTSAATGVDEDLEDWSDYIPQDGDIIVVSFETEP